VPQSKTRKKPVQRTTTPPDPLRRLHKATEECVNLVRDLRFHLTEEQHLELRAGALGMLITLGVLTGKPDPRELASVSGHTPPPREGSAS
jgi:hypothetical protein